MRLLDIVLLCCVTLTSGLLPQTPTPAAPPATPATGESRGNPAHDATVIELAQLTHELDTILERMLAVQGSARIVTERSQSVAPKAKDAEMFASATAAADLPARIAMMSSALAEQIQALRELRRAIASELPAEAVDALAPLRARIDATGKMLSITDALAAMESIESELEDKKLQTVPGRDALLAFARYRTADTRRMQAALDIKVKSDDRRSESTLRRSLLEFAEVLDGPDLTDTGEGSSLHAAALRRIIQINSSLYGGYKRLSAQQPTSRAYADSARKYREALEIAVDQLRRVFPESTLPDGSRIVDAIRDDVARLAR
ncbi:MAG: hypothetical protein U1F36_10980 [Planctomycetota bacterium]